ncbi:MAG: RHS repeat-associated core domain-containing protein [Bacteroidales bacterium]|nr:RHS repeat-associated core domain-containing protein [Bacteroidales bacterium]
MLYANPSERPDPLSYYVFYYSNYRNIPDAFDGYAIRGYANRYDNGSNYCDETVQKCIYTGSLAEEFVCGSVVNDSQGMLVENEPDIFHFSFLGYSGSFILQPGNTVRFLSCNSPSGELSVSFSFSPQNQGANSSFVFTDGLGVRYTFAAIESAESFDALHGSDDGIFTVSAWKLSTIVHPSGKTVTFTYTDAAESNVSPVICADHQAFSDGSGIAGRPVYEQWTDIDYYDESLLYNTVNVKRLSSISIAGRGNMYFGWNSQGKLSYIRVYNGSGRLLKECNLSYYVPKISSGLRHQTLAFLTSVSLSGEGTYYMTYDSADDNHVFPTASFSSDNDLWYTDAFGYYNAVSLKSLFDSAPSPLPQKAAYITSNRIPNLARTRMGTLSSITYPAGGHSAFVYEQNDWSRRFDASQARNTSNPQTAGLRVSRIDTFDENGVQVQCRKISYLDSDGYSSGILLQEPNIYYKYHFTSTTPGVDLKVEREAVSTASSIGYSARFFIEYLRIIEEVSTTPLSSPVSRTVHTFNSSAAIYDTSINEEYVQEYVTDQTEFTFVNDGTTLHEWQNHGTSFYGGLQAQTIQASLSQKDPQIVTSCGYGLYSDTGGAVARGKMLHFGRLCERVYNTCSPYMNSSTTAETASDGTSGSVTTTVTVDSRGRTSSVSRPDSHGSSLTTAYTYHATLPGLITGITVTRGGSAVSATKYDYYCKNGSTCWYVPSAVSARLVNGSYFGDWRTERTFSSWDAWGNPGTVTDAAGRTTAWTWGYDGLHPVSSSLAVSGATVQNAWTWIPMVGLSSFTGPSGRTTSYYYDSAGRLTGIYNAVDDPLERYSYYYPGTGDSRTYSDRTYIATTTYNGGGGGTDVAYYDGLGRLMQTVRKQASGSSNTDIVAPCTYDALGRIAVDEYPYPRASNSGALRTSWASEQHSYYEDAGMTGGDDYLFGVGHTYENRSDGRALSSTLPGYDYYVDYGTAYTYGFNTSGQLSGYSAGTCSRMTTTDGDGNVSVVWTDREGRTVQEDRYPSSGVKLSTVYIYDARGNLTSIQQPKGTSFSYSYDALGRQTMKTVPGSGAELFVYDSAGRIVLSQDGNLRDQNRWVLNTWDAFDCLVKRQLIYTTLPQSSLQSYFPVSGSGSLPSSAYTLIGTIAEYGYMRSNGATAAVPSYLAFAQDATASTYDIGSSLNLKIYEKLLCLPEYGSSASAYASRPYVERAFYHDDLGRELQTVEKNILGGITRISTERDQVGNPLSVTETVSLSASDNNPTVKHTEYNYDIRGRLTGETVQMGGSTVAATTLTYDALGRPSAVSGNGLTQTQSYNLHGWLASIQATSGSSNVFNETLRYAEAVHATPLHTGAITEVSWQHGSSTTSTYAYEYDGTNRLLSSNRYFGSTLDNSWTERNISYDANGNITAIARYGSSSSTPIDNLSLTYSGNTLTHAGNSAFSHDSCGNLVYDPLRGLTISYNLLGYPSSVTSALADEADYCYLADGTKARVLGEQSEDGFAYMGSIVFSYDEGDWVFDSTPFVSGRIRKSGSSYVADRYATDHLGSVRAIVRNGQVTERNDYYPYGGRHANSALTVDATNRWRFSGKEIQTTASVNLLDFGARMYDDRLCRWTTQDPLAEKYYGFSPYVYCAGEPVGKVDVDGQDEWEINTQGKVVNHIYNSDYDAFHIVDMDGSRLMSKEGTACSIYFTNNLFSLSSNNVITSFFSTDASAGADLFKFLSDNTVIENGLIIGSFGAFIFNEGTRSSIHVSSMAKSIGSRFDVSFNKLIHSHPQNNDPSDALSHGDISTAKRVFSNVQHFVYVPLYSQLILYNGKGIQDRKTWKSVFPDSRF